MKKITLLLILLTPTLLFAQKEKSSKMGQTTLEELKMTVYDKDSTASAVVLYEHANLYVDKENDFDNRTDYYYRIKILNKSSFDLADIDINLYSKKRVLDIRATTYNINEAGTMDKNNLLEKDIFTLKEDEDWTVKKFTMPNIKEGTVIEYTYSILSPYSSISDWYFQSDIPKIKSEYDSAILGNYKYNVRVIGYLKLDKDNASIKQNCIEIPGIGRGACVIYSYGMYTIPAFKEEEYMLSKKNYVSRVSFDLKSFTNVKGLTTSYTTTWKKADKSLKNYFFNNQTSKKNFFKSRIPETILNIENKLERTKKVFNFIKEYYTWNDKNWTNEDVKLREAYTNKSGNVGEINLSLYNSLKAANIDADLVVLSTRNNGFPTKLYPIIYDYNYVIIKVNLNGENYYLDATEKYLPFGQVPVRALNGEARTIDAEEDEHWKVLKPRFNSNKNIRAELTLNKDSEFVGNLVINRNGYFASNQREIIYSKDEDAYLEVFETDNPNIEVEDYSHINLDSLEKSFTEKFKVKISLTDELSTKTRINPFFFFRTKKNPFKLKERNYPVNFGYPRKNNFSLKLKIPENYKIIQLPKNLAISLPNKGGRYILKTTATDDTINITLRSSINKKEYSVKEYFALKEFYKQIIIAEKSYIIIEKE
jgi:hypothetical protein